MERSERTVPHIPLPNLYPLQTFYQFMRHENNNVTPEEARRDFIR